MDTTNTTTQANSAEFVPDVGGTESTSAGTVLVLAYLVLWILLMGFVGAGWRKQRSLAARLTEVEKALSSRTGGH